MKVRIPYESKMFKRQYVGLNHFQIEWFLTCWKKNQWE
jgi:hypothetical protein